MSGEERVWSLVGVAVCAMVVAVAWFILLGHRETQGRNRACIASGGDVVLDNCIRRNR